MINVLHKKNDILSWREWIKPFMVKYKNIIPQIKIEKETNNEVSVYVYFNEESIKAKKSFKRAFIKASYCIGCRTCEAQCGFGAMIFDGDKVIIDENKCCGCLKCYSNVRNGCLVYESLRTSSKHKEKFLSLKGKYREKTSEKEKS